MSALTCIHSHRFAHWTLDEAYYLKIFSHWTLNRVTFSAGKLKAKYIYWYWMEILKCLMFAVNLLIIKDRNQKKKRRQPSRNRQADRFKLSSISSRAPIDLGGTLGMPSGWTRTVPLFLKRIRISPNISCFSRVRLVRFTSWTISFKTSGTAPPNVNSVAGDFWFHISRHFRGYRNVMLEFFGLILLPLFEASMKARRTIILE